MENKYESLFTIEQYQRNSKIFNIYFRSTKRDNLVRQDGRPRSVSRYHSLKSPNIRSPSGVAADIYRWASQGTSSFVESKSGLGLLEQSHQNVISNAAGIFFRVISMQMIDGPPYSFFFYPRVAITRIFNLPVLTSDPFPLPCLSRRTPRSCSRVTPDSWPQSP